MKNENHSIVEPEKRKKYKKKYILRMLEQQEALAEIQKFDRETPPKDIAEPASYKQGKEK
jgi:hypothetical protein